MIQNIKKANEELFKVYFLLLNENKISAKRFEDCREFVKISIPSTIKLIEKSAFYGCSSMTQITIPSSVTSIES